MAGRPGHGPASHSAEPAQPPASVIDCYIFACYSGGGRPGLTVTAVGRPSSQLGRSIVHDEPAAAVIITEAGESRPRTAARTLYVNILNYVNYDLTGSPFRFISVYLCHHLHLAQSLRAAGPAANASAQSSAGRFKQQSILHTCSILQLRLGRRGVVHLLNSHLKPNRSIISTSICTTF